MSALLMADRLAGNLRNEINLSLRKYEPVVEDARPISTLNPSEKWQRLYAERIGEVDNISVIPAKFAYAKGLSVMIITSADSGNPPRNVQELEPNLGVSALRHLNKAVNETLMQDTDIQQIIYGVNGGLFRSIRDVLHIQLVGIKPEEWNPLREEGLDEFKAGSMGLITRNFLGREIAARVSDGLANKFPEMIDGNSIQLRQCGSAFLELSSPISEDEVFCREQFDLWKSADILIRDEFKKREIGEEYRCHAISFTQDCRDDRATMTINAAVAFGKANGGIMESNRLVLASQARQLTTEENMVYFATGREFLQRMH